MDLSCILNSPKASAHCPSQVVRNQQKNLRMNTPLSPFTNTDNTTLLNSSGSVCHYSSQYSSVAHPGECSVAYVSPRTTSTSLSSTQPDFPLSDSVRKRKSLKPASAIVEESETSAKRKKCGACRKSFYSSTHLEIHEETVRLISHIRLHKLRSKSPSSLLTVWSFASFGLQVHQKLKRYKCPKCGSSFGQSGTLTRHILTVHEKRRDYQCLDVNCLKRFSSAWSLKVHIVSSPTNHQEISESWITNFNKSHMFISSAKCTLQDETLFLPRARLQSSFR